MEGIWREWKEEGERKENVCVPGGERARRGGMETHRCSTASMSAPVSSSHSTALLQWTDETTTEPSSGGPSPPTQTKTGAFESGPFQYLSLT